MWDTKLPVYTKLCALMPSFFRNYIKCWNNKILYCQAFCTCLQKCLNMLNRINWFVFKKNITTFSKEELLYNMDKFHLNILLHKNLVENLLAETYISHLLATWPACAFDGIGILAPSPKYHSQFFNISIWATETHIWLIANTKTSPNLMVQWVCQQQFSFCSLFFRSL